MTTHFEADLDEETAFYLRADLLRPPVRTPGLRRSGIDLVEAHRAQPKFYLK
jgi:hypothetical protein